jgi:hypothetical protein
MVKSWARELVNEYETDFAPKLDWEAARQQPCQPIWTTEEKDGYTYTIGQWYWPPEHGAPTEMFEVSFKKSNFPLITRKSRFMKTQRMWVEKGKECHARYKSSTMLKGDDDTYYRDFCTKPH